ncbi:putative dehydrogenase [Ereboglobus sp. PH5-5]|uniref:Gfo/Idh/MocA family oxidoreductase n=1 Tax=Ereboglobus sp. PH5-5 TaxID=2940529 RepID=UPI00240767D0|nr:Gfo/Idh/MocA family oxidoreductase [Ereboglobus sp. PH5-5]MDF9833569.1 putative dehydrogenase [Ereboglobus sp. PH5-5]
MKMKNRTTSPFALAPHTRRSFLKMLGAAAATAPFITRNLFANTPSTRIRHAAVGVGHMGWQDLVQIAGCDNLDIVALCDVDEKFLARAKEAHPNARVFSDWRKMLDAMGSQIDTINVSTPDHMHAAIAVSAMQRGIHAYVEKPLAHELHEVRRMAEIAREKKLVTQMGIQIHSNAHYRIAVQTLRSGAIGKVREVHSWCYKTWGDDKPMPARTDPVPAGLDWDCWLGVREARPYIGPDYYHPKNWRKRLDFGTGTLGDMACHIFDPVFKGLDLAAPISVRSEGPLSEHGNWALNARAIYTFAKTRYTAGDTMRLCWYDGTERPPAEVTSLIELDKLKDNKLPNNGSIFVGEKGALLLPHYSRLSLYPSVKFADFQLPRERGANHWKQFIEACRGNGKTSTHFDYSGPLTEAVLLGGIASRFPQTTLKWDSPALRFDLAAANRHVRRPYRKGWEVAGL